MSLAKFALRQAVLAALVPPAGAPWPTMVGARWYDSLMGAHADLVSDAWRIVGVISTPDGQVRAKAENTDIGRNGGFASVVVVISLGMVRTVPTGDGGYAVTTPATDAELDASLDLAEHQVLAAIARSRIVRAVSPLGIRGIVSLADRDPDSGQSLAGRRVEIEMSVIDDLDPGAVGEPPVVLARLIAALPEGSRQREIAERLAEQAATPTPEAAPLLPVTIDFRVSPTDPEAAPGVRVDVTLDPEDTTADPAAILDPEEWDPEGPREETDPRNPFAAPKH